MGAWYSQSFRQAAFGLSYPKPASAAGGTSVDLLEDLDNFRRLSYVSHQHAFDNYSSCTLNSSFHTMLSSSFDLTPSNAFDIESLVTPSKCLT